MFTMSQKLLKVIFILVLFSSYLYSSNWKLETSLETGPSGIHFVQPMSVYVDDTTGRIYVVDSINSRFVSFSNDLKPLKEFNAGGEIKLPIGMIKDLNGNIWTIERATNSIVFIDLKNRKVEKKKLNIFADRITKFKNYIVVVDRLSGSIVLLDGFKIIKKIFPSNKNFKGFFDVKVKKDLICGMENLTGNIYCFNEKTGEFKKIFLKKRLIQPVSFDFDNSGNIYIVDRYLKKIFIFDNNGNFLSTMLEEGERSEKLYYPWEIMFHNNRMYVVDEGNGRVDIFKK